MSHLPVAAGKINVMNPKALHICMKSVTLKFVTTAQWDALDRAAADWEAIYSLSTPFGCG